MTLYTPDSHHTAIPGFVYGGLIASVIDCHGTGSASLALHRKNGYEPGRGVEPTRFVTATLHGDYLQPTPEGKTLKAVVKPEENHPKKWKIHVELFAGEALCAKGEVVAALMPATFTAEN